jgi:hypothetical protein
MGVSIYVKNYETKIICTYNKWNIFRQSIIKTFIEYLEDQLILNKYDCKYTRDDIVDFISQYYQTIYYDTINFENFNKIFDNYYINLFILHNYYGFYIFITKEDNNSYFSVGNAIDMLSFFNLIELQIEEEHIDMFNTFKLLLLFSYENRHNIYIK